jgi:hypothetical protein
MVWIQRTPPFHELGQIRRAQRGGQQDLGARATRRGPLLRHARDLDARERALDRSEQLDGQVRQDAGGHLAG